MNTQTSSSAFDRHGVGRSMNLPAQLSSFIGREAEVASVREAIMGHRLVSLTGAGGCGKTGLAYEVATLELQLDRYDDGVWCVELAPVASSDLVAQAIAAVFGLREEFGRPVLDTLTEQLRDVSALIVVDNCEHLLDGVATVIETLLNAAPAARHHHEPRGARRVGRGRVAGAVARRTGGVRVVRAAGAEPAPVVRTFG